jgi:hypothetical protein
VSDLACHRELVRLFERHPAKLHVYFRLIGLAFCLAKTARQKQMVRATEHGGERVNVTERDEFPSRLAEFLAQLAVRSLQRILSGFDPAADNFEGRPVHGILPFPYKPYISVVLHGENAGSVLDLDELVDGFGSLRQDYPILAKANDVTLMYPAARDSLHEIAHVLSMR